MSTKNLKNIKNKNKNKNKRKNKKTQKGLVHAIDAVIGGLILLIFASSVYPQVEAGQWDKIHVKEAASDILWSIDHIGLMNDFVQNDDHKSFNALVHYLAPGMDFSAKINGIPKREIKIVNILDEKGTLIIEPYEVNFSEAGIDPHSIGLEDSDLNMSNRGTLFGMDFYLIDTILDNFVEYNKLYLDLDNDGIYESSWDVGGLFVCNSPMMDPLCDGDIYEIGPLRRARLDPSHPYLGQLTLYNATFSEELKRELSSIHVNSIEVSFLIRNANLSLESILDKDIAILHGLDLNYLNEHYYDFKSFLENGGSIIEMVDLGEADTSNKLQEFFGFKRSRYGLKGTGSKDNVLFSTNDPAEASFQVAKFFFNTPFIVDRFFEDTNLSNPSTLDSSSWIIEGIPSNNNIYNTSMYPLVIKGVPYNVLLTNSSDHFDTVYFSSSDDFTGAIPYHETDMVNLEGNTLYINSTDPLSLFPQEDYTFRDMKRGNITSDYPIIVRRYYSYNVSDYDIRVVTTNTIFDPPPGAPHTDCPPPNSRYRYGNFALNENYNVTQTNYRISGTCDPDFEYINFDLNGDGDFNDTVQGVEEGPYQNGDIITLEGESYRIYSLNEGKSLLLKRVGISEVGTVMTNQVENGYVSLFPNIEFGEDEYSLLRSLILFSSIKEEYLVRKEEIGYTAVELPYLGIINESIYLPYSLQTVWWYS